MKCVVRDLLTELRPRRFHDVIGQASIVKALANMISGKKIPNAILFTGPMGTGKSTLASLLVKATCCTGRKAGEHEPCGACDSCEMLETGIGSFGCSYFNPGYQPGATELMETISVVADGGLMWSGSTPNALWIDDIDFLAKKSQVLLRGCLDERWDGGYLVATTMMPEKLDPALRQRMTEFCLTPPGQPALETWAKGVAIKKLSLVVEEDRAIDQVVCLGELNYRGILKILASLYAGDSPINSATVKLAALQCGYGLS